jgi:hypothetical protein
MKRSFLFFVLTILSFTLLAQHNNETSKQKLKRLDFLLGQWSVEVEGRLSAQGPWENSNGTSEIIKTLDSTLVEEEFRGTREGRPFLSKTLFAINNQTNSMQRIFIDAPHGVLIDFEGAIKGDSIIFDKTWTIANASTVKLRVVYTIMSNDNFMLETMRMPQGQTKWDVNGRMRYKRIKYSK